MAKALIVELLADAKQFGRELDKAAGKTRSLSKVAGVAGLAIAGGLALGLEKSVKSATEFQSSMQLLTTQAGVSEKSLGSLKQGVLALAGPTATAPEELAKGIYHLASQGLRGKDALDALKIAAEGAKVGQADLEDVTNALGAAIASHIKGTKNLNQAMGAMNATVGAGDMRMQDLADAMGTGVLATAKLAGVGLRDVNAALAVFGDNNIRGAKAGTLVASALRLMSAPSKAAAQALGDAGISANQLANVLRREGLPAALTFLQDKMTKAGLTATQQSILIGRAFGGKQATGIKILLGQMGRLQSKEEEVGRGASGFGSAWKKTTETTKFKFEQMKAAMSAVAINLGSMLIPAVTAVASKLATLTGWLSRHTTTAKIAVGVIAALGGMLIGVSVATKAVTAAQKIAKAAAIAWTGAQWLLNAALDANPIGLIVIAIAALAGAFIYAWTHSQTFRDIVTGVWHDVQAVTSTVVNFFTKTIPGAFETVLNWFKNNWPEVATLLSGPFAPLVAVATNGFGIRDKLIGAFVAVKNWFSKIWGDVKNLISRVFTAIIGQASRGFGIPDAIKGAFVTVKNWFGSIWSTVSGLISGVFTRLVHFAESGFGLKDAILHAFDYIKNQLSSHWPAIKQVLVAPFELAKNLILGIINKIINVIQTVISWINKALSLIGKLAHAASHIPHGGGGGGHTIAPIGGIPIKVPGFASGGIVTGPTLAVVGEAGPEAIVPLGRGGMGGEVHVHVGPIYGTVDAAFARMLSSQLATELRNGGTPQLQQAIQAL